MPQMGDTAAQLCLSLSHPAADISCQAREGIYLLAQILLHHKGKEAQPGCKTPMETILLSTH